MATGLYVFMIAWNEFLFALLFLAANRDKWTVSLGLQQLAGGIEVPKTVLMAGSVRPDDSGGGAVLRRRAAADRGPDQRRREELSTRPTRGERGRMATP